MFRHRFDQQDADNRVVAYWFMLSFNGGCINAGGFLATGKFVSHVTGFATLFGVNISSQQIVTAFGILSVPIFFLLGAFTAGLLIDRPVHYGRKPHFDWVMGLSSLCLFLSVIGGEVQHFGIFGTTELRQSYLLMVLLCLASGLQNGAITTASGHSVRTTHLTGLTTDLGLGLARAFSFDRQRTDFKKEVRANFLRFGSIISFVVGSAAGAFVFIKMHYGGFILPGLIAAYASWQSRKMKHTARVLPVPQ